MTETLRIRKPNEKAVENFGRGVSVFRGSTDVTVSVDGETISAAAIEVLKTAKVSGLRNSREFCSRAVVNRLIKLECLLAVGSGSLEQVQITQRGYTVLRAAE